MERYVPASERADVLCSMAHIWANYMDTGDEAILSRFYEMATLWGPEMEAAAKSIQAGAFNIASSWDY